MERVSGGSRVIVVIVAAACIMIVVIFIVVQGARWRMLEDAFIRIIIIK